jgi:hypothetical protein
MNFFTNAYKRSEQSLSMEHDTTLGSVFELTALGRAAWVCLRERTDPLDAMLWLEPARPKKSPPVAKS